MQQQVMLRIQAAMEETKYALHEEKGTWLEIQLPRTFYEQLPESAAIAQNTLRIETTEEKRLTK